VGILLIGFINVKVVTANCVAAVGIVVAEFDRLSMCGKGHDVPCKRLVVDRNGIAQRYVGEMEWFTALPRGKAEEKPGDVTSFITITVQSFSYQGNNNTVEAMRIATTRSPSQTTGRCTALKGVYSTVGDENQFFRVPSFQLAPSFVQPRSQSSRRSVGILAKVWGQLMYRYKNLYFRFFADTCTNTFVTANIFPWYLLIRENFANEAVRKRRYTRQKIFGSGGSA